MRRNEILGLRWPDFDEHKATISINRGLVAVAYEVRVTRGKTPRARRLVNLDTTTVGVLTAWRTWQQAEQAAAGIQSAGWMFTDGHGEPINPHAISQAFERIEHRAGVPTIRLHDYADVGISTTYGTPTAVCSSRKACP